MKRGLWEKIRPYAIPAAGIAGMALLLGLLSISGREGQVAAGEPAPAFDLTDLSGRSASLADYRGKILLIDFWATWCLSCEEELPELKALYHRFQPEGFDLLAASVDEDEPAAVAEYTSKRKIPYRVVFADRQTVRRYRVFELPMKFLIDEKGIVFNSYAPQTPVSDIEKDIRILLDRSTST